MVDPQGKMREYVKRFRSRGTRQWDFATTCDELIRGINLMIKYRMKIVVTRLNRIVMVVGAARVGDLICRDDNCGLPILLRERESSQNFWDLRASEEVRDYRFVGEVLSPAFRDCDCDRTGCTEIYGPNPGPHQRRMFWIS